MKEPAKSEKQKLFIFLYEVLLHFGMTADKAVK